MNGAVKGICFLLMSNIAFCAMGCLVRYGSELNASMTTMFRFMTGMGVIGIMALFGRIHLTFVDKPGLFLRGLLGGIAICSGFVAIVELGLVKASIIIYTYPIFATFFSSLILKEKLNTRKILALIVSFSGVLLVLTDNAGKGSSGFSSIGLYELIAVMGAVLAGLSSVFVKKLQKTDSSWSIYFAQCLIGFWIVVIPAGHSTTTVSYKRSVLLLFIGLLSAAGQLVMTEGYRYITVSTGSVIVLLIPAMNILAGVLFFGEKLTSNMVSGSLVILISSTFMVLNEKAKYSKKVVIQ